MDDDVMLTTYDNSFNPFKDFNAWWKEDLRLGHDCCGTLARMVSTSMLATDSTNDAEILDAINEIVDAEPLIYRKVTKNDFK